MINRMLYNLINITRYLNVGNETFRIMSELGNIFLVVLEKSKTCLLLRLVHVDTPLLAFPTAPSRLEVLLSVDKRDPKKRNLTYLNA